jgi:hypothetical protein
MVVGLHKKTECSRAIDCVPYCEMWWHNNHSPFQLLPQLALHILCIPATSAPTEEVFTVAGLTTAKAFAWLAPQTANESIFWYDALLHSQKFSNPVVGSVSGVFLSFSFFLAVYAV